MVLLRYLSTVIGAVLIATGTAQAVDVKKAVGDQVSFRPDKLPVVPSVTSVIWKHRNTDGVTVKAIEWDEGEILTPNPRFKDITTVDEKTGQINITNLKYEHSGVYFFEINSKEQQQRFTLTVMDGVPTPKIKEELIDNSDVVYLRCEYSEPIIWKNSAGDILTGSPVTPKGESITVKKTGNPETFYTCTLKNAVSEKTSDPVYEKDLFNADSNVAAIVGAIFVVIIIIIVILIVLYLLVESIHNFVNTLCPCIRGSFLDRFPNKNDTKGQSTSAHSTGNTDDDTKGQNTGLLTIDITGQSTPADSNDDTKGQNTGLLTIDITGQSTPADSNGTGVKDDSKDVGSLISEIGTADPQQQ